MNIEHEGLRTPYRLLDEAFDLEAAVDQTAREGYCFWPHAVTDEGCTVMAEEAENLNLRATNSELIGAGTLHEVSQSHERAYVPIGHEKVPIATLLAQTLMRRVLVLSTAYPELAAWQPTEAGYQRYRDSDDGISPHRDSKTDQLLGVTVTVYGSTRVRAYESLNAPDDYSKLRLTEEFHAQAGSVMLLKAPGLGDGERTIHEALPPETGSRLVLNLRMRPDVVRPPEQS